MDENNKNEKLKPDFLIVGAPRSGTRSLKGYLNQHPDILSVGEFQFFDRNYEKGWEWYSKQFEKTYNAEDIIGEKTAEYMTKKCAVERIKEDLPEVKMIFILRNPVDRIYSWYWHQVRLGNEDRSFEEAIEEGDYIDSSYLEQIKYFEDFPDEQKRVVIAERFWENPMRIVKELYDFLGADDDFEPKKKRYRHWESGAPRSKLLNKFAHEKYDVPIISNLLKDFMPYIRRGIGIINLTDDYPEMDMKLREYLEDHYEDEIKELEEYLSEDLEEW